MVSIIPIAASPSNAAKGCDHQKPKPPAHAARESWHLVDVSHGQAAFGGHISPTM
jgi:hypothetical protein